MSFYKTGYVSSNRGERGPRGFTGEGFLLDINGDYDLQNKKITKVNEILPNANNSMNLGSNSLKWKDLYLAGVGYISTLNNGSGLAVPTSGTTLISDSASQSLTNKTISSPTMSGNWIPSGTVNIGDNTYNIDTIYTKNITNSSALSNLILSSTSGGVVEVDDFLQVNNSVRVDSIENKTTNGDLTLATVGIGKVLINDSCNVTGQLNGTSTTDASSTTTGSIITAGGVGVAKKLYVGTGLYLPTSGGTQSELNYYESKTQFSVTVTGALSTTTNITASKVGTIVTIHIQGFNGTSAGADNIYLTSLPARFRPSVNGISHPYVSFTNSTRTMAVLTINESTGVIVLYANVAQNAFSSTGTVGMLSDINISYIA